MAMENPLALSDFKPPLGSVSRQQTLQERTIQPLETSF